MWWWEFSDIGDGLGHFCHQNPINLSFDIGVEHQHSKDVTNIEIKSPTSINRHQLLVTNTPISPTSLAPTRRWVQWNYSNRWRKWYFLINRDFRILYFCGILVEIFVWFKWKKWVSRWFSLVSVWFAKYASHLYFPAENLRHLCGLFYPYCLTLNQINEIQAWWTPFFS